MKRLIKLFTILMILNLINQITSERVRVEVEESKFRYTNPTTESTTDSRNDYDSEEFQTSTTTSVSLVDEENTESNDHINGSALSNEEDDNSTSVEDVKSGESEFIDDNSFENETNNVNSIMEDDSLNEEEDSSASANEFHEDTDDLSILSTIAHENDTNDDSKSNESVHSECIPNTYFAHENNCSRFYSCETGGKIKEGLCPPNMWFDPNYQGDVFCNYPEVICATDNNVCNCAFEYPINKISCPIDHKMHFFPSPAECEQYYLCYNNKVFRMQCKFGLYYNEMTQSCDIIERVKCNMFGSVCPIEGMGFLSHPERQDAFIFCINGHKSVQVCPFFHIWDSNMQACQRKNEIKQNIN